MTVRSDATYEVYAIRYASHGGTKQRNFCRYDLYGEPNAPTRTDYFFWLLRGRDRTVVVDTGFDRARGAVRERYLEIEPTEALQRLGVAAADVDHVILSHMHYDHVGNVGQFPGSSFTMARAELDFWTGPLADRPLFAWSVHAEEVAEVATLAKEERLTLMEDRADILPGISATRVGGHSPGQIITEVATATGTVVLASDAIHFYEEMEADRPFFVFTDLPDLYRGYARLRELAARPDTTIVAGHDPRVMTMFTALDGDCADMAVRIA